jgi:hypothetical protein
MPDDNGSRHHQDERLFPSRPQPSQRNPEQLLRYGELAARPLGVESQQLLTQGKVFEDEVLAGPESTNNPTERQVT